MKQECYLLDPMVDLFDQIEEGLEFVEAVNTPIPGGGGGVNIAYLLILRTEGMEKSCDKWEDMQFVLKNWKAFKEHFQNPTDATRSEIKQQLMPMYMVHQKIMHSKHSPKL